MSESVYCRTAHIVFSDERISADIFFFKGFPEWCVNYHVLSPLSFIK